MAVAYFDCFAGAGGDMIVAALLDAGLELPALEKELSKLDVGGYALRSETVQRCGLAGTRFTVEIEDKSFPPGRKLSDILDMIARSELAPRVAGRASSIFTRLAQAEAYAHATAVEQVHFHEIGAIDSIVDIVAACVGLELLGVEQVYCSAIPIGSGTFECSHGTLPAPAPATARLLVGAKTTASSVPGEVTTPTAAAVLTSLAERYGAIPPMTVSALGCGAGSRDTSPVPNLLRVFVGELDSAGAADTIVELSANIDDCTGEMLGSTIEKLLAAGCVDAWVVPIIMKKSRPGWMLSGLCSESEVDRIELMIFEETTTFGVRRRRFERSKLLREHQTVETPYGPIRVKIGRHGEREMTASAEFGDCETAAAAHNVPIKEVIAAAQAGYRNRDAK
jgi:uncharacterized protein (TIGR00299 family) protein